MAGNNNFKTIDSIIEEENIKVLRKINNMIVRTTIEFLKGNITEKEAQELKKKIPPIIKYNNFFDDIILNRLILIKHYDEMINLYNNYDISDDLVITDIKDLDKTFHDFLKYYNCEELFNAIERKKRIIITNRINCLGLTFNYGKIPYIAIKEESNKLNFYDTLAHEIGHALELSTLYNKKGYYGQTTIKSEVISMLFNTLFTDFLLLNNDIDKESIKNKFILDQYDAQYRIKNSKSGLNLIDNPDVTYKIKLTYTDHDEKYDVNIRDNLYAIGNIASAKLLEINENDTNYFRKHLRDIIIELYNLDITDFFNEYLDIKAAEKRFDKRLSRKK